MTDLFHENVEDWWIDQIFAVMALCPPHTFITLTKRAERMRKYFADPIVEDRTHAEMWHIVEERVDPLSRRTDDIRSTATDQWPLPNVILGVSCGRREFLTRVDDLRMTPAAVRMISFEPLLEDVGVIDLSGIGWAVVGGESGPKARPMVLGWAKEIVRDCKAASVPVFVKQLGARPTNREGVPHPISDAKGGNIEDFPLELRVREFPR